MACTTTQTTSQVLEAMEWSFGGRECRTITFSDDTAGSLSAYYFDLNAIDENGVEIQSYVWLNNGSSVDPMISGKTGIEVSYANGDNAETIAVAFEAALASLDFLVYSNEIGQREVENAFLGEISVEDYANAPLFTRVVNSVGFGGSLGALQEGGASLSTSQELVTITSDATGAIPLDEIMRGGEYVMTMPLVEMTTERWQSLVGEGAGANYEPSSYEGTGYGTSKLFKSTFANAGQLIGHPVRLPKSDRTADISVWKSMPIMDDVNFSGSEVQVANMTFKALKDGTKPDEINMVYRGDHSLV